MGYQIVAAFAPKGSCGMTALRYLLCCNRVITLGTVKDKVSDMPYVSIGRHILATVSGDQEECIEKNNPHCL